MPSGALTSYNSNTNLQPLALNPVITMIDWTEAALLRYFGINNEGRFRFTAWPRREYYWHQDTMSPRSTTLAEAVDPGETAIDVTDGTIFKEGDIIRVDDTTGELMQVTSVASNTLTVVKGFAGTDDSAHDTALTVEWVTSARLEGADYDLGHTTTVSRVGNYTQILEEAVMVTKSELKESHYGVDDIMSYHIEKLIGGGMVGSKGRAGKLAIGLQNTFYHGRKALGSDGSPRSMDGFEAMVTTYDVDKAGATLTLEMIEDMMEDLYNAGGTPKTLICNTYQWRVINTFWSDLIRYDRSEKEGGQVISSVRTIFGDLDIVWDRWAPQDRLYFLEKDKMGWITYRPFDIVDVPTSGDYIVKDIVGEFGFVLQNQSAHGFLYNLATS